MNKPDKFKKITQVSDEYCDNLLKIFDKDYNKNHNNLYQRDIIFKKVDCDFTINKFKIENKEKLNKFINISKNLLKELKNLYGHGTFSSIQIAKMSGGGVILPHIDDGLEFVFSHRIHIPLITNKNVIFTIDDEDFYFPPKNVYELNNLKVHSVKNNNPIEYNRIHLILDYISEEYIPFLNPFVKSNKQKFKLNYN